MVSISVRGLTKRFGSLTILDQVDVEIGEGELFFLLGPSGCGKTTLLRHIAGFYKPDAGSICFDGDDVTRLPPHKRGAAMMFQSYALWPHLNVAQNIAFGLEERKRPAAEIEHRVQEALEVVKLAGLGSRRIPELSGGQQQRVALARALVVRPRCLLLDEPLSNLDARLRHEMRSEIRRICKDSGLTAIYVTHDRDEALSMADRAAIMDGGRLVQQGAPEEIYRQPANAMAAAFIGDANFIPGTVQVRTNEGFYEVQTACAMLRAAAPPGGWQPHHGEKVLLAIRPEALTLGTLLDSPNQLLGRIVETIYLGATVQYLIRLNDGLEIKVNEANPRRLRSSSTEPLRAMVAAEDIVMLQDE